MYFFQILVIKTLDLDPDPHWKKMLDPAPYPDPHWNQSGSTTLLSGNVFILELITSCSCPLGISSDQNGARCRPVLGKKTWSSKVLTVLALYYVLIDSCPISKSPAFFSWAGHKVRYIKWIPPYIMSRTPGIHFMYRTRLYVPLTRKMW